jgi:hypothetical protein
MKDTHHVGKTVTKTAGIVLIVIGAIVLLLGFYAKFRVSEAKLNVQKSSVPFSDNPVNKQLNEAMEKQISAYDAPIMWTMVGGAIIVVIGVAAVCFCHHMNRKKK